MSKSKKKECDEEVLEGEPSRHRGPTWVGYAPRYEKTKKERERDNERKEKQRRRSDGTREG